MTLSMPVARLLLSLALFSTSLLAETTTELLHKADQAIQQSAYSTALIHFKNAARQSPDKIEIRLKLADLFIKTGKGVQAEVELDKATRLGATFKDTAVLLAKSKLLQGKFEEVTENIDLLDLPQSEIARLRALQGHAYFEQRKFFQARQMFQRANHLDASKLEVQLGQARLYQLDNLTEKQAALIQSLLKRYPESAEVLLVAGNFYRQKGDYKQALALFKKAGELQPTNVNVWFGVVRSYIGLRQYNNAKLEIQKVLTSYPEHQVANYLLSVIAYEQGDYDRARAAIDIVLKGDKRKLEALKLLSTIQFQQKDYTEAEKNLKKYLQLHPSDKDAHRTLASIYLKRKQGTLALEQLQRLNQPNDAYILSMMATAYLQLGNQQKANQFIRQAIAIAPNEKSIRYHLQRAQLEAGITLDFNFTDNDFSDFINQGHIAILNAMRKKQFAEAERLIQGYLQKKPDGALLYYLLGSNYLFQNKREKAAQQFKLSIDKQGDFVESRINLAKIYQQLNRQREAEREFREVLRIDKNNDQALVALAGISARAGNDEEMLKWLNKSRRTNSASLASREVLEKFYRKKGEPKKALELAQEMVQIQPQNINLLLKLANDQKAVKRLDLAIKTFNKIVALESENASVWMGLGRLQYLNKSISSAQNSFEKVLQIEPDNLPAKVILTQIDLQSGQLDSALQRAKKIKAQHPDSPAGFDMSGDIYVAMGKPEQAIKQYQQSIKLKYASDTYLKLFSAYNRSGQPQTGFKQLQQWVKQNPQDLPLKEALAITFKRRGELDQALDLYQQILQKVRNNDRILNSASLVAFQLNSPMSLEYADLAMNVNPKSAKNKDTFGWILFKTNNDLHKAEKLLRESVKVSPSNPDYRYHLAALLAEKGDRAAALKNLYLAMGTQSEFKNKAAALKLLAHLKK